MGADLDPLDDQERVLIVHALTELATKQTMELDLILSLLNKFSGVDKKIWIATWTVKHGQLFS